MYYKVSFYDYELGYYVPYDKILHGFTIHETIDDTLDFATIVCHADTEDKFRLWQSVKVEVWNGNFEEGEADFKKCFLIADIDVTERHTIEKSFIYTITSIEPTKYLEKVICSSMGYTNKEDTLLDQLEKALINAEPIEDGQSPRFRLSQRLENRLSGINGEDFFFTKPTLREILDGMLSVINCRAEVHEITDFNSIEIDYYELNEVKSRIEILEVLNKQTIQNIEYLGADIEAYGDNSFSGNREAIYHPSPNGWDTFKTQEATLTSENAAISTEFPIEEIKEFIVPCALTVNYRITLNTSPYVKADNESFSKTVNIVRNVVDEETYNILENSSSDIQTLITTSTLYKKNIIYYTRGSDKIRNLKIKVLFSSEDTFKIAVLNALMNSEIREEIYQELRVKHPEASSIIIEEIISNLSYKNAIFRIKYIPYIDAHARIGKVGYSEVPSTIIDNQSEKIIDLERYGGNLYGTINRLGNKELKIDRKLYSINDDYNIGDITADGYVLTSKDLALYNGFIKAHYEFTKDFGKLNEKIGINREKRIYNIPLESFVRDNLIKEYIIADFVPNGASNILLSEFLKTFDLRENKPITNALIQTKFYELGIQKQWSYTDKTNHSIEVSSGDELPTPDFLPSADNYEVGTVGKVYNNSSLEMFYEVKEVGDEYLTQSNLYELSIVPYTMATSMLFKFRFDDNYSAGMSSEGRVIGGIKQVPNPYVNSKGEYDKIHIRLFNDSDMTKPPIYDVIKDLPKTEEYYYNLVTKHFDKTYQIKKDAYEHHQFTIQFEIVSNNPNIIIGFAIAKLNALLKTQKEDLKIYVSTNERYAITENRKVKGVLETNQQIITTDNSIIVDGNTLRTDLENVVSWGIADSEGNLLIGVNKDDDDIPTQVYFSNKTTRN